MDGERTVTVAVQVLPLCDDPYPAIDRAIEAIAASGVRYQVCPMETVMEGPLDRLLEVAGAAHSACFEAGADRVVTVIRIADSVGGSTIEEKMRKYER